MASFKIYRVVNQSASAPTNFVSGSTAAPTSNATYVDKGVEVTFQNQSTGAVTVYVGDSAVQTVVGSTSTLSSFGISLAQNGTFQIGKRHSPTAINMNDFWFVSTSTVAICTAFLLKAV